MNELFQITLSQFFSLHIFVVFGVLCNCREWEILTWNIEVYMHIHILDSLMQDVSIIVYTNGFSHSGFTMFTQIHVGDVNYSHWTD